MSRNHLVIVASIAGCFTIAAVFSVGVGVGFFLGRAAGTTDRTVAQGPHEASLPATQATIAVPKEKQALPSGGNSYLNEQKWSDSAGNKHVDVYYRGHLIYRHTTMKQDNFYAHGPIGGLQPHGLWQGSWDEGIERVSGPLWFWLGEAVSEEEWNARVKARAQQSFQK